MKSSPSTERMTNQLVTDHRPLYLLLLPLLLLLFSSYVYAWYYNGWSYRVPITISNSNSTDLTDYQVKLTVDTASLISAGKMNSDCSDMRFTYYDASTGTETNIPYWIEANCNDTNTVVWVKVPSIPANGTATVYMYYGNSTATSESNGDAVFDFWDDFIGGSLDTTKWSSTGDGITWGTSIIWIGDADTTVDNIYSNTTFSAPYIVEANLYSDGTGMLFGFNNGPIGGDDSVTFYQYPTTNTTNLSVKVNGTFTWVDTGTLYTGWHIVTIKWYSSGSDLLIDYTQVATTTATPSDSMPIVASDWSSTAKIGLDWIRVRKYASSEPTATFGAEENVGVGVSASITHTPTAQSDLALDPENNITSITVDYNAIFNKNNVVVTYYRAYDGDTNATLVEGNDDANYVVFSRTYTAVGDYNTCVYVEAVDDQNNTYTDTACDVVHIDEYPQGLNFDWNQYIPFPNETIEFNGSATDNGTLTFSWDFGDTATATGNPATHSYTSVGTYTVTMTVTDDVGLSKSVSKSVPVYEPLALTGETNSLKHTDYDFTITKDGRLSFVGDVNFGDGRVIDVNIPNSSTTYVVTNIYSTPGTYTVEVNGTLSDGTNTRQVSDTFTASVYDLTFDVVSGATCSSGQKLLTVNVVDETNTTQSISTASHAIYSIVTYPDTYTEERAGSVTGSSATICTNADPNVKFDVQDLITDTNDQYAPRTFKYWGLTVGDNSSTIYLVKKTDASPIDVYVLDSVGSAMSGVLVEPMRYDYSKLYWYGVAMETTDNTGKATLYLIPFDVYYKFRIRDPDTGKILYETAHPIVISSSSITIQMEGNQVVSSYADYEYNCSYDENTSVFKCVVQNTKNLDSTVELIVSQHIGMLDNTLCDTTATGYTLTLLCNVDKNTPGRVTYSLVVKSPNNIVLASSQLFESAHIPSRDEMFMTWLAGSSSGMTFVGASASGVVSVATATMTTLGMIFGYPYNLILVFALIGLVVIVLIRGGIRG